MNYSAKLVLPVCLYALFIVWITGSAGTFIPNLTENCYRCLCHVATECALEHSCTAGYCGPFNLSRIYWVEAGKVVMPEDDPDRNHAWEDCARNYGCAKKIIEAYLVKLGKDCNGDGVTNCYDYMMTNGNGGYGCTKPLNEDFSGSSKVPVSVTCNKEPSLLLVRTPYAQPIPGELRPGRGLRLRVTTSPNTAYFFFNLQSGISCINNDDDVQLHVSLRFHENIIVRNHWKGVWGSEDRDGGLPVRPGTSFEIQVLCTPEGYEISINGNLHSTFKHRLEMRRASYLAVVGDATVQYIGWEGPPQLNDYTVLPFAQLIPGGMYPGVELHLKGSTPKGAKEFGVSMQYQYEDDSTHMPGFKDPLFHMSFRLNDNAVVRNTWIRNWGYEEQDGGMPLTIGQPFDLRLTCDISGYQIYVNGKFFASYTHRLPYERARYLLVYGDVDLQNVAWSKTALPEGGCLSECCL